MPWPDMCFQPWQAPRRAKQVWLGCPPRPIMKEILSFMAFSSTLPGASSGGPVGARAFLSSSSTTRWRQATGSYMNCPILPAVLRTAVAATGVRPRITA